MSLLRCENITCRSTANTFRQGLIEGVSASFESGDLTGFCGSDTAAKELLLSILGLIERPDRGSLVLFDQEVSELSEPVSTKPRDTSFGYLFTHPHLLPSFTVAENTSNLRHGLPLWRTNFLRIWNALSFVIVSSVHFLPRSSKDAPRILNRDAFQHLPT